MSSSGLPPRLCLRLPPFAPGFTALLMLALLMPAAALAHRVNIFAWTEGGQAVVECAFSGGNKVREGEITVFDAATDTKLLEGRTDATGVFRFAIPPEGKTHGLRIRVRAGEGHQNEWTMDAAELAATEPPTATGAAAAATAAAPGPTAPPAATPAASGPAAAPSLSVPSLTPAIVQQIVTTALEAKLAPIRRELAEMRVARPGIREIVGGTGWLIGLAGIALYFKRRRG